MATDLKQEFCALRDTYIEKQFGRLNEMQRKAVFTTNGPLLILAGAGSGKTTVLVNRIANLIRFGSAHGSGWTPREVTEDDVKALRMAIMTGTDAPAWLDGMLRKDAVRSWNVMAITFTNKAANELKERLGRMIVGYTYDDKPVSCAELKAAGAMTALLKDAIKPNLVQTLEGTPAFVHGGPFANIAHGCNSVMATRMALKAADYAVTEAGFGADLGAEKFLDIKCRASGLRPAAVVVVATVRALKMHGGLDKSQLDAEDLTALERGIPNLLRHVRNIKNVYHLPCVVALNRFPTDTEAELKLVEEKCAQLDTSIVLSDVWAHGGEGGKELAEAVVRLCEEDNSGFGFCYEDELGIEDKISAVVRKIYGGRGAVLLPEAKAQAEHLTALGFGKLPVCIAKTQSSFSDDAKKLGAPEDFTVTVRQIKVSAGAGFTVALAGNIMTMPGLPSVPAAEGIDIDDNGRITGLF